MAVEQERDIARELYAVVVVPVKYCVYIGGRAKQFCERLAVYPMPDPFY